MNTSRGRSNDVAQCKGIRKRLRCRSVFVNTYVDGSGPGEMPAWSMMRAPGMGSCGAVRSMPPGGRSGNDFPGGTGIASVLPDVSAAGLWESVR